MDAHTSDDNALYMIMVTVGDQKLPNTDWTRRRDERERAAGQS